MRARTILLLGTPAVIAAVAVAVPAIAGNSATSPPPVAKPSAKKKAASSKTRCFTSAGRHRARVCEVAGPGGPRGPRGPRGFVGSHGKRGLTGAVGMTGPTGPSGVARAYALVGVREGLQLVASMTHEIAAVTPISTGIYCLASTVPTRPSESSAAVSGESSYSVPGVIPLAVLNARHPNCGPAEFEVETYKLNGKSGPELSGEVAFTLVAP